MCTRVYAGRAYRSEGHKHGPLYTRKSRIVLVVVVVVSRTRREVKFIASSYAWRALATAASSRNTRFASDVRVRVVPRPHASASAYASFVNTRVTCCLKTSKCET